MCYGMLSVPGLFRNVFSALELLRMWTAVAKQTKNLTEMYQKLLP